MKRITRIPALTLLYVGAVLSALETVVATFGGPEAYAARVQVAMRLQGYPMGEVREAADATRRVLAGQITGSQASGPATALAVTVALGACAVVLWTWCRLSADAHRASSLRTLVAATLLLGWSGLQDATVGASPLQASGLWCLWAIVSAALWVLLARGGRRSGASSVVGEARSRLRRAITGLARGAATLFVLHAVGLIYAGCIASNIWTYLLYDCDSDGVCRHHITGRMYREVPAPGPFFVMEPCNDCVLTRS